MTPYHRLTQIHTRVDPKVLCVIKRFYMSQGLHFEKMSTMIARSLLDYAEAILSESPSFEPVSLEEAEAALRSEIATRKIDLSLLKRKTLAELAGIMPVMED